MQQITLLKIGHKNASKCLQILGDFLTPKRLIYIIVTAKNV